MSRQSRTRSGVGCLRRIRRALRRTQGLFRTTFEQAAVGIAHVGPDGRFLRINRRFCDLVGYAREEMLGRTFQDITHPDDLDEDLEFVQRMLAGEIDTYSMEKRYRHKDGRAVWVNLTVSLVRDPAGEPEYFISVVQDVGDKKRVQRELEHRTAELRERLKELRCLYAVSEVRSRHDLPAEEVLGRIVDLVPSGFQYPEAAEACLELPNRRLQTQGYRESPWSLSAAVQDGETPLGTFRVIYRELADPDQRNVFLPEEEELLREFGNQVALFLRRSEMEARLRESKERAEEASRLKSVFLASVSHELRTPMNSILGYTELLLDGVDGPLLPDQEASLRRVRRNAQHLLHLITELLDFSRIEAGKLELARIPFSLREAVSQTLKNLEPLAQRKTLELSCSVDAQVPDILLGDAPRLEEVLLNLGENAIKFTARGFVSLGISEERREDGEATLRFSVRDTGVGIPEDKQRLIFDAFAQANAATGGKQEGLGLGLAISSQLVAMMGGRLWVESKPGEGSCFHFTARFELPRDHEASG